MIKRLLIGLALFLGLGASWVVGQAIVQTNLSGTECWNAGQGPGGPSTGFLCTYLVRNGTAMTVYTSTAVSGPGPSPSILGGPPGTVMISMNTLQSTIYWSGTAPTQGLSVSLPGQPFDGEQVTIGTNTALNAVQVTVTSPTWGTSLPAPVSTIPVTSSAEWQFSIGTSTWERIR